MIREKKEKKYDTLYLNLYCSMIRLNKNYLHIGSSRYTYSICRFKAILAIGFRLHVRERKEEI
jgi:hypothetical protein